MFKKSTNIKPIPDEGKTGEEKNIKNFQNDPAFDNAVISWVAPNFSNFERGKLWKLFFAVFIVLLVVYAFFTNAWSMAIAFIVFAGVYLSFHQKKPRLISVKISEFGIKIGNRAYPYHQIKAFWIVYKPPRVKTLNFVLPSGIQDEISVELGAQDPILIRNFLLKQIPEWEGKDENLTDILSHLFKF